VVYKPLVSVKSKWSESYIVNSSATEHNFDNAALKSISLQHFYVTGSYCMCNYALGSPFFTPRPQQTAHIIIIIVSSYNSMMTPCVWNILTSTLQPPHSAFAPHLAVVQSTGWLIDWAGFNIPLNTLQFSRLTPGPTGVSLKWTCWIHAADCIQAGQPSYQPTNSVESNERITAHMQQSMNICWMLNFILTYSGKIIKKQG